MATRRFKRLNVGADMGLTVLLQAATSITAFVYQAVFTRTLSQEESGLYFLAISIITVGGGIGDFGIMATAYPRLSVARGEITPTFKAAIVIRTIALFVAWLLLNAYMVAFGKWVVLPLVNIVYISVFISSKATGLRQAFEMILRLRGRTYVVTLLMFIDALAGLGAVAFLAWTHQLTLTWLAVIFALSNLPGCIAVTVPLVRLIRESGAFRVHIPMRYYKMLAVASLPVAAMVILQQSSAQLETFVIESYKAMSHADIAFYNAAIRPLTAMLVFATTLGIGLAPLVSQHAKGMRSDYSLGFLASLGVRIAGSVSLVFCLGCGLFAEPIMSLFGHDYVAGAYILRMYSVISALMFVAMTLDQFLLSMGRRKQSLMGAALALALALATEPITIRMWGIRGMMYSKMLAIACLIAFQLTRLLPEMRAAALAAIGRLLPTGLVLLGILLGTASLWMPLRIALVVVVFTASFAALRTVRVSDLTVLRTMRTT